MSAQQHHWVRSAAEGSEEQGEGLGYGEAGCVARHRP